MSFFFSFLFLHLLPQRSELSTATFSRTILVFVPTPECPLCKSEDNMWTGGTQWKELYSRRKIVDKNEKHQRLMNFSIPVQTSVSPVAHSCFCWMNLWALSGQ